MHIIKEFKTIEELKEIFPDGEADRDNFCLFSTSGVHGHYGTIEEIEFKENKEGWINNRLTFLIVLPRVVCLVYGHIKVAEKDIDYLKKLRQSSWDIVHDIGREI